MTHEPTDGTSPNAPRPPASFGHAPDPVDAAIERHLARREDLQHAADAVDAAGRASERAEAEADAAFTAAGQADGAAWADLLATRPTDVSGAVRLLRYVSVSPASEVLEDPQDLLRQLTEAVAAAEAGEKADRSSANLPTSEAASDPVHAAIARHRAAWTAWHPHLTAISELPGGSPGHAVAEAAGEEVRREDEAAFEALVEARPTTAAGLRALADYLPGALARNGTSSLQDDDERVLHRLQDGILTVIPAETGEPDTALAVTAEFRRTWDAANAAARAAEDGDVPEDHLRAVDDASAALRAVRPITPEGFRALASTWAYRLGGDLRDDTAAAHAAASLIAGAGVCVPSEPVDWKAPPVDWHAPQPGFMASPAIEPFGFVLIPEGIAIELGRLRGIALAEFERRVEAGVTGETKERLRRSLQLDTLSKAARGEGSYDIAPSAPLDWQAEAARRPGFVPYPAHAPSALVALDLAIQGEASRLLTLAEAEVERWRRYHAEHSDPEAWARAERGLRHELRMDALAAVAAKPSDGGPDPVLAAIEASRRAEATMAGFGEETAAPMTPEMRAREDALCEAQRTTRATAWATVPTTHAGRVALVEYARFQIEAHRAPDGDVDSAEDLLGEILGALEAAIRGERPEMASALATDPDAALLALGPTIAALITARDTVPPDHEDAYAKIDGLVLDEGRRLAAMRARTLAGLVLKARFVERGADEELKDGIVADLLALGGGE